MMAGLIEPIVNITVKQEQADHHQQNIHAQREKELVYIFYIKFCQFMSEKRLGIYFVIYFEQCKKYSKNKSFSNALEPKPKLDIGFEVLVT